MAKWRGEGRDREKVEGEKERDYGQEPDTTQAVHSSHQTEVPPPREGPIEGHNRSIRPALEFWSVRCDSLLNVRGLQI